MIFLYGFFLGPCLEKFSTTTLALEGVFLFLSHDEAPVLWGHSIFADYRSLHSYRVAVAL